MHAKVYILFFYGIVGITTANSWYDPVGSIISGGTALIKSVGNSWKVPFKDRKTNFENLLGAGKKYLFASRVG